MRLLEKFIYYFSNIFFFSLFTFLCFLFAFLCRLAIKSATLKCKNISKWCFMAARSSTDCSRVSPVLASGWIAAAHR